MQELALTISLVLMLLLAAAFIFVISRASSKAPFEDIVEGGYKVRSNLFRILLISGVIIAALSLPRAFAPIKAWAYGSDIQTIRAVGYQWYWELDAEEVIVGKPVEFLVDSADVTHGFGIYDEDLRLLAQIQAMPGYTNRLNFTFNEPGIYQILCLEYCGLAHHDMVAEITALPAPSSDTDSKGADQ